MESFFGIGLPELIFILIIAGIVMGPERIGHIARWLGKTTAQLQAISRGFMRQLQSELDGVDDGQALKEAMGEVQALRKELESLRTEFVHTTKSASREGKVAMQEIEHSIQPPQLKPAPASPQNGDGEETAVTPNDNPPPPPPAGQPDLPNLRPIPDDPE